MMIKKKLTLLLFALLAFSSQSIAQGFKSELIWGDPVKLEENINSSSEEALLLFSRDSSNLYFVREGHPENQGGEYDQDIWYSTRDEDGGFTPAKPLKSLNNKDFNAVVGVSMDGQNMYLYNAYVKKKNQLERGIAISKKKDNKWQSPTKLDIQDFKVEGDHFSFYVNPQETHILISHSPKDSKGLEDLYVSVKQSDGTWGKPISLGDKINTQYLEISPFLSEDTYTLFFSSDRPGGLGDADIYVSFRLDETWTNWSEPQNLGDKVNSAAFDAYFIMSDNDAYFASNRNSETSDIYHIRPIEPEVEEPVDTTPVVVEPPVDTVPKTPQIQEFKIYFALNSSYMDKEAKRIIDDVIAKMKADPSMKAEVNSHADKRADDNYNEWLTKRRANRVKDYMVLMGIEESRIETNWFGKRQLAVKCDDCTEEEHRLSRRTTIKLEK